MHSIILIVDGAELSRPPIAETLAGFGYRPVGASTGREASGPANVTPPDLVLLGTMLPDVSGFEACRCLRRCRCLAGVPIVMLGIPQDRALRIHGLEAGADSFLCKPIDSGELVGHVKALTHPAQSRRLQEGRARFALLLERIPDALVCVTPTGAIRLVNPAAGRLLGIRNAEQLVGRNIFSLLPREENERFGAWFARPLPPGSEVGRFETRFLSEDGTVHPVILNAVASGTEAEPELLLLARDITEETRIREALQRRTEELEEMRLRLDSLTRQSLRAQENERRHLARELHDELGQALTAVRLQLLTAVREENADRKVQIAQEAVKELESTLQWVRNLSSSLRPAMLDDFGLIPALRWFLDRQGKAANLEWRLTACGMEGKVPLEIETIGFRVAQEAVTNVVRHAGARHLAIRIRRCKTALTLTIRDDGTGFSVPEVMARAARGERLGIRGMQERVALAGGSLRFRSSPGCGTTVAVLLPLGGAAQDRA